jgi:hypothetical protein
VNYHSLPFEYLDLLIDRRDPRPERLVEEAALRRGRRLPRRRSR